MTRISHNVAIYFTVHCRKCLIKMPRLYSHILQYPATNNKVHIRVLVQYFSASYNKYTTIWISVEFFSYKLCTPRTNVEEVL